MATTMSTTVRLNNGVEIPRLGLGVFQTARGEETRAAVRAALAAGYRHVDTARIYGNEADVGAAIKESDVPRSEVFVTTKLWNEDQGFDTALRAFDASLGRLGLDYVDMYLLHWPVPRKRLESWRALERLLADGKCRAIGVSNFLVRHLEELLDAATVVPAVNQVELSPFGSRRALVTYCATKGIAVEAYSPLTKGQRLAHPAVVHMAKHVGRTPAQVLLRWGLQHNFIVLPKSTREERIRENSDLFGFELSPRDMAELDALDVRLVTGWDPETVK
jgi:methylglyoxal/glyoxal reductase